MNKTLIAVVVIILLILGGWYVYQGQGGNAVDEQGPIKIGLSAPLTGQGASWGQNSLAGATLAVKEFNDQGGINGRQIELIAEDDKATPKDGVSVFTKFINIDKVAGIVGPIASSAAGPALPLAQAAKIPVIMIASAPQFTSLGEYMFRVYPSDSYQGNIGAEFMVNELKVKKVALMYTQNDYGQNLAKVFKEKFVSLGGEITFEGSYPDTTAPDFRTDIAKIKTSDSQAIYSVLYPANAVVSFRQLKEMKVNLPIMGADGYSGEEVTGNTFADGVIFGVVKTNMRDEFTAKIKSLTGFTDLQVAAPALFAYDATNALLTAIKEAGSTDGTKIKNALGKVSVAGVSNEMIKFGPDREVENPSFEIRVIKNKTSVPYVKN